MSRRDSSGVLLNSPRTEPHFPFNVNAKKIIVIAAVILLCFVAGFVFADSANRKEQERLRAELARARETKKKAEAATEQSTQLKSTLRDLSDEDLRALVARADEKPDDANIQHITGQALHLYFMETGNTAVLPDMARILKRAYDSDPTDYDILLRLANSYYLLATNGEPQRMSESRTYFEKALTINPKDIYLRVSLAMTYFHATPPDPRRAVREFRQALAIDPRDELTLQNMPAALIAAGEFAEAEKLIDELENIAPAHEAVSNLRAQLAQKRNAAREGN